MDTENRLICPVMVNPPGETIFIKWMENRLKVQIKKGLPGLSQPFFNLENFISFLKSWAFSV